MMIAATIALLAAQAGCAPQQAAVLENLGKQPCQIQPLDGPTLYVGADGRAVPLSPAECEAKKRDALVASQRAAQARAAVAPEAPPQPQAQEYEPNWKKVEADNGQVYHIDLNSIHRVSSTAVQSHSGAAATIYFQDAHALEPVPAFLNLHAVLFWCPDRMQTQDDHYSSVTYLPPGSIGRRLADIACAGVPPHN